MTTLNGTYVGSGAMQDHLRFLRGDAVEKGDAQGFYRCYCRILHEYQEFAWFDAGESPHIVDRCDSFEEFEAAEKPGRRAHHPEDGGGS